MSAYTELVSWLESNSYDLNDYSLPAQGQIIYEFCKEKGIQVPQFKDNRRALYKIRGYKVYDAFMQHRAKTGGEVYNGYINLGELPLRSLKALKLAKKIESLFIDKDAPRRLKLEHGLTRNPLIHLQFAYCSDKKPPESVKIGRVEYKVNIEVTGESDKWNRLYSYDEQVKRCVTYLYKPGNMAGTEGHNRLDIKHHAYLEWYLEQKELHGLTPKQRKLLNVRAAWNKNIKVK